MSVTNEQLDKQIAIVERDVKYIQERMVKQDVVLSEQSTDIKKLVEMSNKSSGAIWALMGVSTTVGGIFAWVADKWLFK